MAELAAAPQRANHLVAPATGPRAWMGFEDKDSFTEAFRDAVAKHLHAPVDNLSAMAKFELEIRTGQLFTKDVPTLDRRRIFVPEVREGSLLVLVDATNWTASVMASVDQQLQSLAKDKWKVGHEQLDVVAHSQYAFESVSQIMTHTARAVIKVSAAEIWFWTAEVDESIGRIAQVWSDTGKAKGMYLRLEMLSREKHAMPLDQDATLLRSVLPLFLQEAGTRVAKRRVQQAAKRRAARGIQSWGCCCCVWVADELRNMWTTLKLGLVGLALAVASLYWSASGILVR